MVSKKNTSSHIRSKKHLTLGARCGLVTLFYPTFGLGKTITYPLFMGKRSMATSIARIPAVPAKNNFPAIAAS